MAEFIATIIGIVFIIYVSVTTTTFRFDANETVKMLTETCSKNGGVEYSKIDSESWYLTCKDSAKFTIKR